MHQGDRGANLHPTNALGFRFFRIGAETARWIPHREEAPNQRAGISISSHGRPVHPTNALGFRFLRIGAETARWISHREEAPNQRAGISIPSHGRPGGFKATEELTCTPPTRWDFDPFAPGRKQLGGFHTEKRHPTNALGFRSLRTGGQAASGRPRSSLTPHQRVGISILSHRGGDS